ncbi:hypothetical protein [Streptomyces sp. NPDC086989]|uniref:hypothetical protein n=1 Tax=Streptomyces sp. NPDC086989 TaxID=3365764 RepID=UPI0037FDE0C9
MTDDALASLGLLTRRRVVEVDRTLEGDLALMSQVITAMRFGRAALDGDLAVWQAPV